MAVELPAGQHLGAPDPAVVLRFRDRMALVALASGDIGHVGAAIVEGRVALEGGMRDLMAAAATAGPFPVARPHRMETTTIPVQITVIAIPDTSPSSPMGGSR